MTDTLYDRDFYAWANEQAALLRAGKLEQADIANIADEIESMGCSEMSHLINLLEPLLTYLLRLQFQHGLRGTAWRLSIKLARNRLADHLEDNPSLRDRLDEAVHEAYKLAVIAAERETGMERTTFPNDCPYPFEKAIDPDFWPK